MGVPGGRGWVYPAGAAVQATGLRPDALRVWEWRYAAVRPKRYTHGRRVYESLDVARPCLLRQVVTLGHPMGRVAALPVATLEAQACQPGVSHRAGGNGLRAIYLGPALPPNDLGQAASGSDASIVALSLVTQLADAQAQPIELCRGLDAGVEVSLGGAVAHALDVEAPLQSGALCRRLDGCTERLELLRQTQAT